MAAKVITAPSAELISLDQARAHLRLIAYGSPAAHPDDDYINTFLIPMAQQWIEQYLERSLLPQTLEIALDCFPLYIRLPMGPVTAITSIKYMKDGAEQTIAGAAYGFDDYTEPATIYLNAGYSWPTPDKVANCIKIRYQAGKEPVPVPILQAALLLIGHFYENRLENTQYSLNELPMGVCNLLAMYRLRAGI